LTLSFTVLAIVGFIGQEFPYRATFCFFLTQERLCARIKYKENNYQQVKMEYDCVKNTLLEYGDLRIDVLKYKVTVAGKKIFLTLTEYKILLYLVSQPERVFTYQQIYEAVWEEPYTYEKNNI